jgi:hypothetical protein
MPRYFFHIFNGYESLDTVGTVLPDLASARENAVRTSGEILRDGADLWGGVPWRMEVADESGPLFALNFSVSEITATNRPPL